MKLPQFKSEIRFGLPMLPLYVDAAATAFIQIPPKLFKRVFYSQSISWMTEGGSKGEVILPRDEYEKMWGWINNNRKTVHQQHQQWVQKKETFFRKVNSIILNQNNSPSLFKKLYRDYISLYALASITEGGLTGSELIIRKLIDNGVNKDDAAFLVSPKSLSFLGQNQLDLLKLASTFSEEVAHFSDIEKKYLPLLKKIQQHSQKYHWILNNYKDVQVLSLEFFFNQIKDIGTQKNKKDISDEIDKLEKWERNNKNKSIKLKKKYTLSEELNGFASTSAFVGEWTDERKALNLLGNTLLQCFASYAEKELGIIRNDLEYFTFDEISTLLAGKKFDYGELNRRREAVLMVHTTNNTEIISGAQAQSMIARISLKVTKVDIIEGTVASQGKVRGKVRIVLDPFKAKLEPGEILVTSMTRPDFVMLMGKAAAFITDEGGITSHAGIVAREMGKPCIVGTNIATKVLQDGDLVEVDAYHGRIKKIKNL